MVNGVFLPIENLDPKKLGENVQMVEKEMEKEVKEGEQKIEKIEEEAEGKLKSKQYFLFSSLWRFHSLSVATYYLLLLVKI